MSVVLSSDGLRKIAAVLDALTKAEAETGVQLDGGHVGYTLASLPSGDALRIVRTVVPADHDDVALRGALAGYGLEIEVP